jgi:hypothetical protein
MREQSFPTIYGLVFCTCKNVSRDLSRYKSSVGGVKQRRPRKNGWNAELDQLFRDDEESAVDSEECRQFDIGVSRHEEYSHRIINNRRCN